MITPTLRRLRDSLRELPRFWRRVVAFQLAIALVTGALFSPSLAWLLDQLIRSTGDYAINNFDLVDFFFSFKGMTFLAGAGSTGAALAYLDLTGLLLITADADRPVHALPVLRYGLRRFPALVRLGLLQLLELALAAAPFVLGLGAVKFALLSGHDINYYLSEHPPEWNRALVLAGLLALPAGALLLTVGLRWVFSLPILLSSSVLPWEALVESWRLTRGHFWTILGTLGGWWAAASAVGFAAAGTLTWFAELLLEWVGLRPGLVFLVVAAFMTLLLAVGLGVSIVTYGVNAILINRMFRELTGRILKPSRGTVADSRFRVAGDPIRILWVGLLMGFVGMSSVGVLWVSRLDFDEDVTVTAHRGSSLKAPENTLSALRQAMVDGADYAEIDVQTTADGEVVLLHDRDFMRLGGDPRRLENLTLAEARTIDVGRKFDPAFEGERVATLSEAIELVRGKLRLNIELKFNRPDPALVPAVVEVLRGMDFLDECVITSLDFASLQQVKRIEPALQTGLIVTRSLGDPARLPVDFLSINTSAATESLLGRGRRNGKAIHVWTVNDPVTMTRMVEMGVDNVITDLPAEMRRLLEERAELTPGEKLALQVRRKLLD